MRCFSYSQMNQGFFFKVRALFNYSNALKSAAYAQEERPMSDAANLDKGVGGRGLPRPTSDFI